MASWQEAVQTAVTHLENANLGREDMQRATREYMATVIKAREEHDAAHAKETEAHKEAIKTGNPKDPVVRLLEATCWAACAQAVRAMDTFLKKIKEALHKHVPVSVQGPLIVNAMSTAFQFQMSMWQMVGNECVHPLRMKHSDWCGLAGMVQAIVDTFPNNCAIMFPQALAPVVSFSATFRPASSKEEDEDDNSFGRGIRRFDSSGEDLDAKDARNIKKGLTPTKVASSNTSQWTEEDIDVVHQIRSKTDLDRFQTYQCNKIKLEELNTINMVDHSAYIAVAKVDPSTVIKKSVFSMATYREVLYSRAVIPTSLTRKWGPSSRNWQKDPGHQTLRRCLSTK